ncbi:MAG: homing endonuclease associated repeat-containing protein [Limisphaerales bacterium]
MAQQRYPREYLLAELRRVGSILDKIPSMDEFRRESKTSPVTAAKQFGGWKKGLASAGFDPQKARLTYQDIEMVEELRRVSNTGLRKMVQG